MNKAHLGIFFVVHIVVSAFLVMAWDALPRFLIYFFAPGHLLLGPMAKLVTLLGVNNIFTALASYGIALLSGSILWTTVFYAVARKRSSNQ